MFAASNATGLKEVIVILRQRAGLLGEGRTVVQHVVTDLGLHWIEEWVRRPTHRVLPTGDFRQRDSSLRASLNAIAMPASRRARGAPSRARASKVKATTESLPDAGQMRMTACRDCDRLQVVESVEYLGYGPGTMDVMEFPGYVDMIQELSAARRWDLSKFRLYRCRIQYPPRSWQVCFAFRPPPAPQ